MARVYKSIEQSWEILFDKYDIVSKVQKDGLFRISSAQINTVKEARLMAKFDQSAQLPRTFKENQLSILPVTRGEYIIGPFSIYSTITYSDIRPQPVTIPNLESIDYTNLYSEASALLFAYNSGIIHDIMGAEEVNFTVNGRMSSGAFDFTINNFSDPSQMHKITVQNAQLEIDAGYESDKAFCICEAKNIIVEEVLIRQLYYPYRLWRSKISKSVIPVFLVYSNDIFHAFIYQFEDDNHYNSLKLLEHKAYTFADEEVTLSEVINMWKGIKPILEPDITFPQANSFARVVDLLSLLYERELTRDEVTSQYGFDSRQTNYYVSACEYLNLIKRTNTPDGNRIYELNDEARVIMGLKFKAKYLALIKKVLERPVFHKAFGLAINTGQPPGNQEICKIMVEAGLRINETTICRRSSTVSGWIDWILKQCVAE